MGRAKKKTLPRLDKRRKPRTRPTPKWLVRPSELDEMAKRRCLMILSVLSGERPVTEVVEEEHISRMTYYQMETRALKAMLAALMPGAEQVGGTSAAERIRELEKQVKELERHKRRAERLLLWTRQVVKPGALTTGAGRKRRSRSPSSTSAGPKPSRTSRPKPTTPASTSAASIPVPTLESKP
jgi:hypothetical protein